MRNVTIATNQQKKSLASKMTLVPLNPSFIYGLNCQTKQNSNFISNDEIIYPAGGVLVVQKLNENNDQTYIHLHDKQRPLNVMCISPKKDLVATGGGGGRAVISLYSVPKHRYLCSLEVPVDIKAEHLECLQFTCDGQFVIAVTSAPDWMLLCYNVVSRVLDSKTRANMATHPTGPVTQVTCNPGDPTTLAVVGPGLFRLLQLVDGSWRQFGFYKAQAFPLRSACWLTSDRLLAGTEDGRLLLVESNELKAVFTASGLPLVCLPAKDVPVEETVPGPGDQCVNAIVAHSHGFLLGLGNPCEVAVYKHDHGPNYPLVGTFKLKPRPIKQDDTDVKSEEEANAVWWLDVSPDRNKLLASSVQVQLYTANLQECPGFLVPLGEPLHRGAVVGLSMCVWRPMFATCGVSDCSVRLWNFSTGRQELSKIFTSKPLCVSLHPLGLFVLVGFAHSVCLFSIQLDELVTVKEMAVRNCRSCMFSPGGQIFAVAHGNKVQLVSSVTFCVLQSLQGHCAQVEGLSWSLDDTRLVTCGADGAVYEWEVSTGKRLEEIVTKGTFYQDVSTIGRRSFVVAGDNLIREIDSSQVINMVPCKHKTELELVDALLVRHGHILLVGSKCGTVLAVVLPLGETEAFSRGMCMHSACVNKLAVAYDCHTVVSCSEDGSVCVWKLGEKNETSTTINVEQVLVGRAQLANLSHLTSTLAERLECQQEEQRAALEHQARDLEQRLTAAENDHQKHIGQLQQQIKEIEQQRADALENSRSADMLLREQHDKALASLEETYQSKLLAEYNRVEVLENQLKGQEMKYESTLAALKEENVQVLLSTRRDLELKITDLESTMQESQQDAEHVAAVNAEVIRQIEHDADKEIVELRVQHERELREEREKVEQLGAEVQSARKKVQGSQVEIRELQQEKQHIQDEASQLQLNITSLEQYIDEQRKLMERNNTILEVKERDLGEVRQQLKEVGKQKETLSYRMEMMSQYIAPKDQTIKEKVKELEQLGRELRAERSQRAQLEVELTSTTAQLKQAQRRIASMGTKERDARRDTERLRAKIHQLGSVLQQPKQLARLAAEIYQEHGKDGNLEETEHTSEVLSELKRQVETVQQLNNSLLKKLKNIEERHRCEKNSLKQECVFLMKELERLRLEMDD